MPELAGELDRLFELLFENDIAIDFLHEQNDREMYRFITEEMLEEEIDDIQIPGMVSHFIYEEFHPNDEDDITDAIEEFLFTLFNGDFKDPQGMHDHILSEESMHDSHGSPISLEEFKLLLGDFYEAYPLLTGHEVEIINILVDGDQAVAGTRMKWHGRPKSEKVVMEQGRSFRIQAGQKYLRRLGHHAGKHSGMEFPGERLTGTAMILPVKGINCLF